ncbi:MAG: hypothetical protein H6817_11230 [Phycisphaerales bacterium]|nr:hypothetical protein [Phycisphaerales bacterium]
MPQTGREIEQARGIDRDVFCAKCAYNLRTRPTVGRCPECGSEYNYRTLGQRGILLPQDLAFPYGDLFWGLLCATTGLIMLRFGLTEQIAWLFWAGLPFALAAPFFLFHGGHRVVRIVRYRELIRTASRNETDE